MTLNLYSGRKHNFYFGGLTQPTKRNWLKLLTYNSGLNILVSEAGPAAKILAAPSGDKVEVVSSSSADVEQEKKGLEPVKNKEENKPEISKEAVPAEKYSASFADFFQ